MIKIVTKKRKNMDGKKWETWKVVAEFEGKTIPKIYDIPENLIKYYEKNKHPNFAPCINFVGFRGLTEEEIKTIYGLAKTGRVMLAVNYFGDVSSWRLTKKGIKNMKNKRR